MAADGSNGVNGICFVVARYAGAGASLAGGVDATTDVIFTGASTTPAFTGLGQNDPLWAGSTGAYILTADEKVLLRHNVPLRASYNGKAFSGLLLIFIGSATAAGPTTFSVGRIAVVPGAAVDQTARYVNSPEDTGSYVGRGSLAPDVAAQLAGAATEASVAERIATTKAGAVTAARAPARRRPINRLPLDVDYATALDMRTAGFTVVDLAAQADLVERGYAKGIQWNNGNNYARWQSGTSQQGKYVFGCLLLFSTNPANLPDPAALTPTSRSYLYSADAAGALTPLNTGETFGGIRISDRCVLLWTMAQCLAANPNLLIGRPNAPTDNTTLFATGFTLCTSDTAFEVDGEALASGFLLQDASRRETLQRVDKKIAAMTAGRGLARLVLGGEGYAVRSYVESALAGYTLRRSFDPFNTIIAPASPSRGRWLFNPREDVINGITVRAPADDATPDHIFGTTLGANHGYATGELTVAGHDKTTADIGSVWATGGNQYTLIGIKDVNTLILTRRADNAAVPAGAYTYVSGGAHNAGFTATATVAGQWYPPAQDMSLRVLVDGEQVCMVAAGVLISGSYTGTFAYRSSVQFIETYDILAKSEMIAWVEATGGAAARYPSGRTPSLRVTSVYEYDRYAQMTVYRDWLVLQAMDVADLMGLQLELLGATTPATTAYYIPNTKAFAYNGANVNYALSPVRGDLTINAPGTPSVFFDATNIEAAGPYLERALALYDAGYVDAAGFLPIADVAPAVRKARVSTKAFEIRGNTGKRYFRVLDKGAHVAVPGDHYAAVGYRHVFPKSAQRTAFYTVRSREADYIHLDWHNVTGLDSVQLGEELIGRTFTVYASRNATVKGDMLAGTLSVSVAATGDYGFLILRVAK